MDLYEEHPEAFLPILEMWAEKANDEVEAMLTRLEEAYDYTPTSVLDIGCGIGRHVIPFAKRGIEAHGLDISLEFIEQAKQRAATAGVADSTSFFHQDMRELDGLSRNYDLLICVATSFGYFNEATNAGLLETFYDRLNPGGVLLLEVNNKEGLLTEWSDAVVENPTEDALHVARYEYDPLTSRLHVTNVAIEDEMYLGEGEIAVRLYTPIELRQLYNSAGFSDIRLFATFEGEGLTRESQRLLVLGQK